MVSDPSALGGLPRVCVAMLALLFLALSVSITVVRLRSGILFGSPADPASLLTKLVRAQGNTAEYVALLALLILMQGPSQRPGWVTAMMLLAVISRFVFATGMLLSKDLSRPNVIRGLGAAGTYVAGVALSLAIVLA